VSEVIYGTPASTRDPARFAVDRATYDRTIDTLYRAMPHAKVDRSEKLDALKRLGRFAKSTEPTPDDVRRRPVTITRSVP
jgi:hypothetical protein